ncbi:MAG: hypothetical protein BWY77_00913 [bacterium ADurb.Bin431]|nr:MAG: hypothetical protein BWY77_00913 [bacterium ADurb.Bin431]
MPRVGNQKAFFTFLQITGHILADGFFLSEQIEQIVLQLKRPTHLSAVAGERCARLLFPAPEHGARLAGQLEKPAGFFFDHLIILRQRDFHTRFELLVQRLPFTDIEDGAAESAQDGGQVAAIHPRQQGIAQDQEGVSGEDGDIFVPAVVDGWPAAAKFIMVHDVIMDQGEVVDHLDGEGTIQGLLRVSADGLAGKQQQTGPELLARLGEGIAHGVVKRDGLAFADNLFEPPLNELFISGQSGFELRIHVSALCGTFFKVRWDRLRSK